VQHRNGVRHEEARLEQVPEREPHVTLPLLLFKWSGGPTPLQSVSSDNRRAGGQFGHIRPWSLLYVHVIIIHSTNLVAALGKPREIAEVDGALWLCDGTPACT
jgi:hypothetical protein